MSVGVLDMYIFSEPFSMVIVVSRKWTLTLEKPTVNLIVGWIELVVFTKVFRVSSPWGQIMRISSIKRNHIRGFKFCGDKNPFSTLKVIHK